MITYSLLEVDAFGAEVYTIATKGKSGRKAQLKRSERILRVVFVVVAEAVQS